jgi:hypothetical protein
MVIACRPLGQRLSLLLGLSRPSASPYSITSSARRGTDPNYLRSARSRHFKLFRGHVKERHRQEVVFEDCSRAPIYENVPEFNAKTMDFLGRQTGQSPTPWLPASGTNAKCRPNPETSVVRGIVLQNPVVLSAIVAWGLGCRLIPLCLCGSCGIEASAELARVTARPDKQLPTMVGHARTA